MQATLDLWCTISDPEQKRELNDHYNMLRIEWEDDKQGESQSSSD